MPESKSSQKDNYVWRKGYKKKIVKTPYEGYNLVLQKINFHSWIRITNTDPDLGVDLIPNTTITTNTSEFIPTVNKTYTYEVDYNYMFNQEIDSVLTIDTAYDLPTGFNISTNGKNIVGYVNFTDTKTVIVKLSDGTIYNIIIKPIFFKKKYIY